MTLCQFVKKFYSEVPERGVNVGKQLEARKALSRLIKLTVEFNDEISKEDIVKGIFVQPRPKAKGAEKPPKKQASTALLGEIRNGSSLIHLPQLYDNIKMLLEKHNLMGDIIGGAFDDLTQAMNPQKRSKLTKEFLKTRVQTAKEKVWIFNTFIPYLDEFLPLIPKNIDVRIIILSPKSRFLHQRAAELKKQKLDLKSFHKQVRDNYETLKQNDVPIKNFKYYTGLPTTPIYIFDNDIYCGFFFHNILAIDSPQRYFDAKKPDGTIIENEFKTIWSNYSEHQGRSTFIDPPRPIKVQAFVDLLPSIDKKLNRVRTETIGNDMAGVYRFARYRSSYNNRQAKPIVTGLLEILPFKELTGAIEFKGKLPNSDKDDFASMHDYSGVVIPYRHFVFMIGETEEDGHPILIGLQRFKARELRKYNKLPEGLVLRRHPKGHLLSARFLLRHTLASSLEEATKNFGFDTIYLRESELRDDRTDEDFTQLLKQSLDGERAINVLKLMKHISRETVR